jgi:hypothetical protein
MQRKGGEDKVFREEGERDVGGREALTIAVAKPGALLDIVEIVYPSSLSVVSEGEGQ